MFRIICGCFVLLVSSGGLAQVPVNDKQGSSFMYYYLKGEQYFDSRMYQEALMNYNEALILYPYHPDSYFSRATTKEKLGDVDGALIDYTIYLELRPNQYDALLSKALILFSQKNWKLARRDFQLLLQLSPGETQSIFFKQDPISLSVNDVFTTNNYNKSDLFNYLGLTEMELGELTIANIHFDSAIANSPLDANYYVNAGKCYEQLKDSVSAFRHYKRALELNPEHAVAKQNMSHLKRMSGEDAEAINLLNEMIDHNPSFHFAWAERGLYYFHRQEYDKALLDFNQAVALADDDASYWLNRGKVNEKLGHWEIAYSDYTKAIEKDENLEKAWVARANLLYQLKRYHEAIDDYDVALFKSGDYANALYNRGLAKFQISLYTEACEDLKKASASGFDIPKNVDQKICGKL